MTPETLAAIHARCFTALPPPWSASGFVALMSDAHVRLVADNGGHGFVLMRIVAGEAELLTLAVDPAFRRQGIARALMDRFDRLAREQGATRAFLEVAENNSAARQLYAACGWQECGRRPGYYRRSGHEPVTALILCKSIAPDLT